MDVVGYLLTQFATIEEVRGLEDVRIANVLEALVGIPDSAHWMVTEPSGASIVIEYANGQVRFFENRLGVITNAPTYDWHLTNLRNYLNLSAVSLPALSIAEMDFAPLGAGSGMIGLPGDNTPPSRFVARRGVDSDSPTNAHFERNRVRGPSHPRQFQSSVGRGRRVGRSRQRS
ncbi:MAG: linear amide C-N hydrolase [Rhodobacteraceae bacterium]|nr:linear amide C-N hydrolase [Paracoccaceae bacterium]